MFKDDVDADMMTSFLMAVSSNSFASNNDGDGFYTDFGNAVTKSENKINYLQYKNLFHNSHFVISHQRIATSGFEERFVQPFQSKEFVIAHNGILSKFSGDGKSDTYNLFSLMSEGFREPGSRKSKIVKTIKKYLDGVSGTFSIVVYDKVERKAYYFKNDGTKIYAFTYKKQFAYLTTDKSNENFLSLLGVKCEEKVIKDYKIYQLYLDGDNLDFQYVGDLDENRTVSYIGHNDHWNSQYYTPRDYGGRKTETVDEYEQIYNELNDMNVREEVEKIKRKLGFEKAKKKSKCVSCKRKTRNFNVVTSEHICEDCMLVDKDFLEKVVNDSYGGINGRSL